MDLVQLKSSFSQRVYIYGLVALSLWLIMFTFHHDNAQAGLRAHRGLERRVVAVLTENNNNSQNLQQRKSQQSSLESTSKISLFEELVDIYLDKPNAYTDLEIVDMLEQFFWGKIDGIAMEIGIKSRRQSMISQLHRIGWKRILLEGDPQNWKDVKSNAGDETLVTAPICQRSRILHYVHYPQTAKGILEFMSKDYMRVNHYNIFEVTNPPGNLKSVKNWDRFHNVSSLECHPVSLILKSMKLFHINFLLVDSAGAELSILATIEWSNITFDVICVENDPLFRPSGYTKQLVSFLAERGYTPYVGQQGRNKWFIRDTFLPARRFPESERIVFRGAETSLLSHDSNIPIRKLADK